jgi:hypothetical protein
MKREEKRKTLDGATRLGECPCTGRGPYCCPDRIAGRSGSGKIARQEKKPRRERDWAGWTGLDWITPFQCYDCLREWTNSIL